jgi:hypothetical protein
MDLARFGVPVFPKNTINEIQRLLDADMALFDEEIYDTHVSEYSQADQDMLWMDG